MKTKSRMRAMAISVAGMLLVSGLFLAPDAFAQARGRSVTIPRHSMGLRGAIGGQQVSHSGVQGLNALGSLLGSWGGGHRGYQSHHDRYSNADAYRDVGIANAAVGLVGTLLNAYGYPPYPTVITPPVEVVPVPAPYPVAVIPSPGIVVRPYPYGYAPSPYPYDYYDYGSRYYSPPTVWNAPRAMGYYPRSHGSHHHDGNYRQSGTWRSDYGGMQAPTYQGHSVQSSRPVHRGGAVLGMPGSHGGSRPLRQSAVHPSGQSHRVR